MTETKDIRRMRKAVALLRITLGIIILATWWENFQKGLYTAQGITDLFLHPEWGIFTATGGGGYLGYRPLIESTILQAPAAFAAFQMLAEFLMGLGLLLGGLTRLAALGATFFFLNLLLAYLGGSEWIWTYVLLTVASFVVFLTFAGREYGIDRRLVANRGESKYKLLW